MYSREIKIEVFTRDKYRCVKCGEASNLTLDHILPISEGGSDDIKNLQTLCLTCNHRKGNNLELTFWQRIKFLWNIDRRLEATKKNLSYDFSTTLKKKDAAIETRFSEANKVFAKFTKDLQDTKNTLNGTLTNDRKQAAVRLLDLENKSRDIEYQLEETQRVFIELIDFLDIEYVPGGFRNKVPYQE